MVGMRNPIDTNFNPEGPAGNQRTGSAAGKLLGPVGDAGEAAEAELAPGLLGLSCARNAGIKRTPRHAAARKREAVNWIISTRRACSLRRTSRPRDYTKLRCSTLKIHAVRGCEEAQGQPVRTFTRAVARSARNDYAAAQAA